MLPVPCCALFARLSFSPTALEAPLFATADKLHCACPPLVDHRLICAEDASAVSVGVFFVHALATVLLPSSFSATGPPVHACTHTAALLPTLLVAWPQQAQAMRKERFPLFRVVDAPTPSRALPASLSSLFSAAFARHHNKALASTHTRSHAHTYTGKAHTLCSCLSSLLSWSRASRFLAPFSSFLFSLRPLSLSSLWPHRRLRAQDLFSLPFFSLAHFQSSLFLS